MALVVTIGGVARTGVMQRGSLRIEHNASGFVSVCSLVLVDEAADIAITEEDAITVVDGATTFFSGRVVSIDYKTFTTQSRNIVLVCQDLNAQLGEVVIDEEEVFTAEDDAVIIDTLFDDYLPAVDSETHVDTIQDPMTITVGPCTIRQALSQICTRSGGYFYVDFSNALHYFDVDEGIGIAWWLSDDPDQADSFSYFNTPTKTLRATTRLDGVFVLGDGVSGWRGTHGVGDRTAIVRDNRITTATGVNERGDAILNKYNAAQVVYNVSTYKAGLYAGVDVRFICALYGVDDTFTVRKLVVKWDVSWTAIYEAELGAPVNPSLTGERIWIDQIDENAGPVTAPRLPTSSKGWSHDIVFTADDFDTIGWGGGDINLADGTVYTIDPGGTGNMAADTVYFIYLDLDTSETEIYKTDTSATAIGPRKLLVATAHAVPDIDTNKAVFYTFGGSGIGVYVEADNIAANAITANELAANAVEVGHITAGAVETDKLDALAVTTAKLAAGAVTATKIDIGGMGDMIYNAADGLLLLGPHSEMSATEWYSLRKQLATLSGAFHQEAGYWQGTKGLVIEAATTNLITNPSIETATTGWAASLGDETITRDGAYSVYGDYALKVVINTGNSRSAGTIRNVTGETAINTEYTFSVWLRGDPGENLCLWMFDAGGGNQYSGDITLTNTWTRHTFTATYGAGGARYVGILAGVAEDDVFTFYADGAQLEAKAYATSYCDGTLGTGYAWVGAVHASTSTRTVTTTNIDNDDIKFKTTNGYAGTVLVWAYKWDWHDWDNTGVNEGVFGVDVDADNRLQIYCVTASANVMFQWEGQTNDDGWTTSAATWVGWKQLGIAWDFTGGKTDIHYILDGQIVHSVDDATPFGSSPADNFHIGASRAGGDPFNGVIAEVAGFDRALTADELAMLYVMNRPIVDAGALDKPGIYILDGKFKIASSTTGNRIEITADRIAGYASGDASPQFYLQASDGKAYAGDGAVMLDENGIQITCGVGTSNRINWASGGTIWAYLWGTHVGANTTVQLYAVPDTGGASEIELHTWDPGLADRAALILQSGGVAGIFAVVLNANNMIYTSNVGTNIYEDLRVEKGLHVGSVAVAPTDNDIKCDGTIESAAGVTWDLGGINMASPSPDRTIEVWLDGSKYLVACEPG